MKIHRSPLLCLVLLLIYSFPSWSQIVVTQDSAKIMAYNSNQFVHYAGSSTVDELIEAPANKNLNDLVLMAAPKLKQSDPADANSTREAYLLNAAANADLVVVGEPQQRQSALTQGNYFIFSDYTVAVDRVYSSRDVTVLPGQTIVVARPGGILPYRGKQIFASVPGFPLFHFNEKYVMFLRFVPETGSFLIFAEAAFNIQGQTVTTHAHRTAPKQDHATTEFLEDVQRAVDTITQGRSK